MTRLLVSVRTLDEALLAAAAGVDLIDVKEPARGPLGRAAADIRLAIGHRLGKQHSLSAACGELLDLQQTETGSDDLAAWDGYRFAKIGLAGCAEGTRWHEKWRAWRSMLPTTVEPVLVCYADGERCDAPCFEDLLDFAVEAKLRTLLFDTWDKRGPGLCQLWRPAKFLRVGQELSQAGISFVLAGKLDLADITGLPRCGASYLGIRGAVCDPLSFGEDARCGRLSIEKIKNWQRSLRIATHDKTCPAGMTTHHHS
jgi:hypothetical protein